MIPPQRIKPLNSRVDRRGDFVLYWMQASQRAEDNHALEFAIEQANDRRQPVAVVFGLWEGYPEANARHYAFMLEGLRETHDALNRRGVPLFVRNRSPEMAALDLAPRASLIVADRGYLRHQIDWRETVAREAACPVIQVESDIVVPVDAAGKKEEYAARTLRPRINKLLRRDLVPVETTPLARDSLGLRIDGENLCLGPDVLDRLKVDPSTPPTPFYRGGASEARRRLKEFIRHKLKSYDTLRGDPSLDVCSHMSPYLHFGQVSPLTIALEIQHTRRKNRACRDAYLDELIVRRELSINFVYYNRRYDEFAALPDWARKTLAEHAADPREAAYTLEQFERAETHDPYWNAAQREMTITGKMHNYMRMYWGKKIIEWSRTPVEAFRIALTLNNKYELDGRDANSYAGVAWVFGKHDRPWVERPIFGKVRYMNAAGLRRKFDIESYVRQVEALSPTETAGESS